MTTSDAKPLDPSLHAYRDDAADIALKGKVKASRFLTPTPGWCSVGVTALRKTASPAAGRESELLYGEPIHIFEVKDGWAWVQSQVDQYVGYVLEADLTRAPSPKPTHRVTAPLALAHAGLDLSQAADLILPFGAQVAVAKTTPSQRPASPPVPCAGFGQGLSTPMAALIAVTETEPDLVVTARKFLGAPYLWGGRTTLGVDCSALVQHALQAAGHGAPRDVYMQVAWPGLKTARRASLDSLRRNDLIYIRGHVALALGKAMCLHACGQTMRVIEEPVAAMLKARAKTFQDMTVRTVPPLQAVA